jgi:hypothetical protein
LRFRNPAAESDLARRFVRLRLEHVRLAAIQRRADWLELRPCNSRQAAGPSRKRRWAGNFGGECLLTGTLVGAGASRRWLASSAEEKRAMNSIIYLVGLVVIVMFILSFLGLH